MARTKRPQKKISSCESPDYRKIIKTENSMRPSFALAAACLFGANVAIALSSLGTGASRSFGDIIDHAHGSDARSSHEPDFVQIERIYKRGRLRSAALRSQVDIDALSADSRSVGENRLVWDLFYPDYNCPYGKSRHGRVGDGGKWICGAERFLSKPGCIVYSLGSNAETSFETDVAFETECEIHVFDPTQTSVPMPATHRSGNENFHRYAIGNPAQNATWETKSLEAVMKALGHTWIEVLKMDIEGDEWEFLEYLLQSGKTIPVGQFLIEFHFINLPVVLRAFDGLTAHGYRVFSVEPNYYVAAGTGAGSCLEFAFVKVCDPGKGNVPMSSWYPRPCERELHHE